MIVKVLHREQEGYDEVAVVDAPTDFDVDQALEYAYRWTNNIEGSWSKKIGADANDNVIAVKFREDGLGLRSTMSLDRMEIDNKLYEVAPFGFQFIKEIA